MKRKFFLLLMPCLCATLTVVSQTPTPTPITDETLRLCVASIKARQFETAVTDCGNAIKKSPAKFEGYQGRAVAYFNLKNNDAGLADLTKALELAPKIVALWGMRSDFYMSVQKYDSALTDINKILEISPNNQTALYRRAQIYSRTGKKDLAIADLKTILAANPNQAEAKKTLAQLQPADEKPARYVNDKYKIAFQIPADSGKLSSYTASASFLGDKSKFGDDAVVELTVYGEGFLRLHPGNAETDSKNLATEKGLKDFRSAYIVERFLDNRSIYPFFEDLETKLVQIGGLNALKIRYSTIPDKEKIFSKRMGIVFLIPVPAHKRYYQIEITAKEEFFARWFANAETEINTFEILKSDGTLR